MPFLNAPLAYNGRVAVTSYGGTWYTLKPMSGAIESQKTLPASGYGDPVLINAVLYSLSESESNNTLAVLNDDGSTKWSAPVSGAYPVLADVQGGIVYIAGRDSGIYAYSATDGTFLWHYAGYHPQPSSNLTVTVVA